MTRRGDGLLCVGGGDGVVGEVATGRSARNADGGLKSCWREYYGHCCGEGAPYTLISSRTHGRPLRPPHLEESAGG